ncbi:MAG: hypothetical protein E7265_09230 [Lachnospiraceae bacterium]|nr:hypothetical protein [Lachnospiraceae bacterium]
MVHRSTDTGAINLQNFTSINNEEYSLNILNGGNQAFDYEVSADKDWIILSKNEGSVDVDDSVSITVDFSKITSYSTGTITIKGNSQTVTVNVAANVIDVTGLADKTYVEAHDYIAIEAGNYVEKGAAATGAEWKEIDKYGRTVSSMKVFPTTEYFYDENEAPYVDYKFYTDDNEKYTLQTHIAPSNNVDWNYVSMKFAVSIDGGAPMYVDTIPKSYIAGTWRDSTWSNAVRNNIRAIDTELGNLSEGEHTLRIYAIDPAVVLEKMIIFPSSLKLKSSYLGPKESYYVGK